MFNSQTLMKYEKKELIEKYSNKIKKIIDKSIEEYKSLTLEINDELTPIQKTNMVGESNRNIHLYHKYLSRLTEEKITLNDYKSNRDKIEGELFDYYRNHSDISSSLRSESAISKYVYAHPCFNAINRLVKTHETLVQFLEYVITMIRDRGFMIKNVIESVKIEMGMM